MGLVWAITSGYWPMVGFTVLGAVAQVAARRQSRGIHAPPPTIDFEAGRVLWNNRRLPSRLWLWTKVQRESVVAEVQRFEAKAQTRAELVRLQRARLEGLESPPRLRLGVAASGIVDLDWDARPHALLIGPTGSGKSALLSGLLADLAAMQVASGDLQVWFADYKDGQTIAANRLSCRNFVCAGSDYASLWRSLTGELDRAETTLAARRILIIEELAAALADRTTSELISQLAAQGRSKGLRIIATNQSVSGLPRALLVNLGNRILLDGTDQADWLLVGGVRAPKSSANESDASCGVGTVCDAQPQMFHASLLPNDLRFDFVPVWSP